MGTKQLLVRAGLTAVLLAALAACGSGTGGAAGHPGGGKASGTVSGETSQDSPSQSDTVTGLRDGVRHVTAKTVKSTRPHLVQKCRTATKKVKHTQRTGRGKKVWYTSDRYRDCHRVQQGTETYRRVVRPARWCVKLDDVNGGAGKTGKTGEDNVWYRVRQDTYRTALHKDAHARIEIRPTGTGC